ncbi:MAG TPA: potassium/proton antiporter [Bauldia sp.]|nr:potassium/proton antiporter [Bauldia sp.]
MLLDTMNIAILIGAALVVAAAFTSLLSLRFGAPLLLVFLGIGLLAGEDGIGIEFDNVQAAYFVGSVALAIILFDSGYVTRFAMLRLAALPALALSTVGVLGTALLVGVAAQVIFGLSWSEGLLLGIIVAPTDAAAVFFLLRVGGITLRDMVRSTLEVESGSNDPIAIFFTLALIGAIGGAQGFGDAGAAIVGELLLQGVVGAVVGFVGGFAIIQIVNRTNFEAGLYPVVVLALALLTYALAAMLWGSGFLAVYIAGLVSGNARMRHTVALARFQEGITWLAQIAMFLTLGLLATPSAFPGIAFGAVLLAAFLIIVARPVAVWVCLIFFRFSRQEMAFISWVGLRGAVSILLATLPVIANLQNGRLMFNVAFVVVLASLLVQGWTIGPVARFLGLIVPKRAGPVDRIELELPGASNHEIVAYVVHPESAVAKGQRIPRWARPSLVIRDGRTLRPHRFGRPQAGDKIYVITTPEYVGLLDRLFSGREPGADDPRLYGEFALGPDTKLVDIARTYPMEIAATDENLTVGALLRRELSGDIEPGDRISAGSVDIIVRRVNAAHEVQEVGIAMERTAARPPRIPLFQSPRELSALVRVLFGKKA